MKPEDIQKLVQDVSYNDGFNRFDRVMLERYFLKEFCIWLPLRMVAQLTGVDSPSTVCLQIKKLNQEAKYRHEIIKIRRMLKELVYGI